MHPEAFSQLGGDFDGDEGHIYPLGSPDSLEEAEAWVIPNFHKFDKARELFSSAGLGNPSTRELRGDMSFIEYTTVSAAQMASRYRRHPYTG